MIEMWKAIPEFHGCYEVSDQGRVRSVDRIVISKTGGEFRYRGRILKQVLDPKKYWCVFPTIGCKKSTRRVHQLVANAFLGPQAPGIEACHRDDDKNNNTAANLVYQTHARNMADRSTNGNTARGERSGRAKLTDDQVLQIRGRSAGMSQHALARIFGVSHTAIWQVQSGKTWTHVGDAT